MKKDVSTRKSMWKKSLALSKKLKPEAKVSTNHKTDISYPNATSRAILSLRRKRRKLLQALHVNLLVIW